MAEEAIELIVAPETCDETTEYDNRIGEETEVETEVEPEVETEEEEQEDFDLRQKREEIERQFARYERNYRARRIRELTLAPLKKKTEGRMSRTATEAAA